jgi:hypothetical protein
VAESSWPSPSNGRTVDDTQYEKIGISLGPAGGVYGDYTSPQLLFADSTGLQVKVGADRYALVRGHVWWSGSTSFTKPIAANSSGSTRIDLVVLRLSRTTWDVTVQILQGVPGSGPPSSTKDLGTTGVWELVLAQVTIASGASTITAGNVNYVATHLGSNGQARVPSQAALAYVPQPFSGMSAVMDPSADIYTRNAGNTTWLLTSQQGPSTFTPTLTSNGGTNPTLGTGGSVQSEWTIFNGRYCIFRGVFLFGTAGVNPGTNQYLISLPFQAGSSLTTGVSAVGSFLSRDTSVPQLYGGVAYIAANATTMSFVSAASGLVTATSPYTWAASDYLAWDVTYLIA